MRFLPWIGIVLLLSNSGCSHHKTWELSAQGMLPWNRCEPEGVPYYLPKPLLVVAKNVRTIESPQIGLTPPVPIPASFDSPSGFADLRANVSLPASGESRSVPTSPSAPESLSRIVEPQPVIEDSFFTFQIVFVPDLSQKYGLRIKGGVGELRAAMNLVNGWMYTGMGPYYVKDSSTAQNLMANGVNALFCGRAAADVTRAVGSTTREFARTTESNQENAPRTTENLEYGLAEINRMASRQTWVSATQLNYAEIFVYEPVLETDGSTSWRQILHHNFDRQYLTAGAEFPRVLGNMLGLPDPSSDAVSENPPAENPPAEAPSLDVLPSPVPPR